LNVGAAQFVEYSRHGTLMTRSGNRSHRVAPQNIYRTARDEEWIAVSVETDAQWSALRRALGDPRWARSAIFDLVAGRLSQVDVLDRHLTEAFAVLERNALIERLWQAGIPVGSVVNPRRVAENEQLVHREFFERVDHHVAGAINTPRFPGLWRGRSAPWHWRPAPTLGQHNADVLGSLLGLDEQALLQLEADMIIGTRPVAAEVGED
jgi:crotonobetainyl-CoA:carnitine CoA-transferase CaiB-like acyl-CoA transferase